MKFLLQILWFGSPLWACLAWDIYLRRRQAHTDEAHWYEVQQGHYGGHVRVIRKPYNWEEENDGF